LSEFLFRHVLPFYQEHGRVCLSGDEHGAALWLPPSVTPRISDGLLLVLKVLRTFGTGAAFRLLKLALVMDKYHPGTPHYYLFAIGVMREAKGKGTGSRLIRDGLSMADREIVPVYLENSNAANRGIYIHLGFEEIQSLELSNGPTLWPTLKAPA
jgi:ribosomal protein S18 acetylase RimI-like enzyme